MKLNKKLSPYPILSTMDKDYVEGLFKADIKVEHEMHSLSFYVTYELDEPKLMALIDNGKAVFVTHIECALVGFRKAIISQNKKVEESIEYDNFVDEVEISTFVVAKKDIKAYTNSNFGKNFEKNASFDIWTGGVLAIGDTYTVYVHRAPNAREKMEDIIKLKVDDEGENIWVQTEGDCLIIYMSKKILEAYLDRCKKDRYTMVSLLFLPAMMSVLEQMKEGEGVFDDFRWYKVLKKMLESDGIEIASLETTAGNSKKSILAVVQKMFKDPIEKAFDELVKDKFIR
mgnify:FL=1